MMTEVPCYHRHDFALSSRTSHENPFLVAVSADFEDDRGHTVARVPGFFAGDGTWIVRFSPPTTGEWRGRTSSDDPALDGLEVGPIRAIHNENARVHGVLGLDPTYRRRFAFQDGERFAPLGFECDWLFSLHQSSPARFRQLVDLLAARGFNYIVTSLYAHTGFSDLSREDVYAPPARYIFGGTNESPDHARLNLEFFEAFDTMMDELQSRGIIVHLMLQVQNKHVNWPPRRSAEDDLLWRYVVARYQAYGNLVWDIGKESYYLLREFGNHDYTLERIALVRETDAYHHLVTVHDAMGDSPAVTSLVDDVCDFVSDQIHLGDVDAYQREAARRFRSTGKPYLNIEYGYEQGAEDIETYQSETTRPWQEVLLWTYAIYFGGGFPCYYYSNAAWDLITWEPEPPGWQRYRHLADFMGSLDLNKLVPDNEFVDRGHCLAAPGRQYAVFLPEGGDVRVDLTAVRGEVSCDWMDIYTGERAAKSVEGGPFRAELANPLSSRDHPCVVALTAEATSASV
jgi:hypothetical protein